MNSNLNLFPSPIVSYISFLNDFAWEPETISNQPNIFLTVPLSLTIFSPKTLYFLNLLMCSISSNLKKHFGRGANTNGLCKLTSWREYLATFFIFKELFHQIIGGIFFKFLLKDQNREIFLKNS